MYTPALPLYYGGGGGGGGGRQRRRRRLLRSGLKDSRIKPQRRICVEMLCYLLTYWMAKFYYYSYDHDLRDRNAPIVTVRWRSGDDATAARRAWIPHVYLAAIAFDRKFYWWINRPWPPMHGRNPRTCNNDMLPPNRKCEDLQQLWRFPHMATPPVGGGLRQCGRRTLATKLHLWLRVHSNAIDAVAHWCRCSLSTCINDAGAHWCHPSHAGILRNTLLVSAPELRSSKADTHMQAINLFFNLEKLLRVNLEKLLQVEKQVEPAWVSAPELRTQVLTNVIKKEIISHSLFNLTFF